MATLTKAVRNVKLYGASPELLLGILLFSMILLAVAGMLQGLVTGSFFFNHSPQDNIILAQKLKEEGRELYDKAQYGKAAEKLQEGIDLQGNDVETRFSLASSYMATSQYKKALAQFKECVKLNPKYASAYLFMYRLVSPYDPARALDYLKKAKEADSASPFYDVELGIAYRDRGQYKQAIAHFQSALEGSADQGRKEQLIAAIAELKQGSGIRDQGSVEALKKVQALALGEVRSP